MPYLVSTGMGPRARALVTAGEGGLLARGEPLERAAPVPARGLGTYPQNAGSNAGRQSAAMALDLVEIRRPGQLSDRRANILS